MPRVEIQIRGHLDPTWSNRFGGLSISHTSGGTTLLTGSIRDQPALHGVLAALSNLNLDLLSVSTDLSVLAPRKGGEASCNDRSKSSLCLDQE